MKTVIPSQTPAQPPAGQPTPAGGMPITEQRLVQAHAAAELDVLRKYGVLLARQLGERRRAQRSVQVTVEIGQRGQGGNHGLRWVYQGPWWPTTGLFRQLGAQNACPVGPAAAKLLI